MIFSDRNLVICGFPGIGKTMAEEKRKDTMDLESSNFKWIQDDNGSGLVENPHWPENYLNEIEAQYRDNYRKIFLVSTHLEVIKGLQEKKIPFLIVAPRASSLMKNEYLIRYLMRGSSVSFINKMDDFWFQYLQELEGQGETVIHLDSGQYLTDILPW